ncbi:LOW QUALITY PROTEIN: neugrin [Xyrichtys novacula]|uniref:Neugrin n=1 Tax=Xyrichtys novacula TaxID=13765 RepID=A0AAV1HIM5_XYRNO|nr:LOW QUALITY PROTEIN: neugrin [Xyrichtys novacula]
MMARPFQLLSILSRLRAPSFSGSGCQFASSKASKAWQSIGHKHDRRDKPSNRASRYSSEMPDEEEFGLEDVEDKLQALTDEERRKQKAVKYQILERKMTPPGAPERTLTWEAMDQIRYLKQEQPEEWTVKRLAEGFSVSPDVIRRVLKSKFVPSPERKSKQDAKIMASLRPKALPTVAGTGTDRLKLPGNRTPAMLPSGTGEDAALSVSNRTALIQSKISEDKMLIPASSVSTQLKADTDKETQVTISMTNLTEEEEEDEESWDGQVFTEEELEQFISMAKPSPVVQVGMEFFDAEGNFLYRI